MGKKKVVKRTAEEVLKEQEKVNATQNKAAQSGKTRKKINKGRAYIQSTYNNTIVTLTDKVGNVIDWSSAGAVGFKGPKKATPYAASRVVGILMSRVQKTGLKELEVYVKGIGSGRESAIRALAAAGVEITLIKDVTPLPHNGPRARKPRRV